MKRFLLEFFTWWNGATLGTRFYLKKHAVKVGEDEFGNTYYRSKTIDKAFGYERRMVIYKGDSEASKIPPGWFGWMHHKTDISPIDEKYEANEWQNPHLENQTGSPLAYRPEGSLFKSGSRPKVTGDYQAWKP